MSTPEEKKQIKGHHKRAKRGLKRDPRLRSLPVVPEEGPDGVAETTMFLTPPTGTKNQKEGGEQASTSSVVEKKKDKKKGDKQTVAEEEEEFVLVDV